MSGGAGALLQGLSGEDGPEGTTGFGADSVFCAVTVLLASALDSYTGMEPGDTRNLTEEIIRDSWSWLKEAGLSDDERSS